MQTGALGGIEKRLGQVLKLAGTQGFWPAAAFMAAVKQTIEVFFDKPCARAHGARVAEQKQNACSRLDLTASNGMDQAIEQFDRRCFIAVDAGRQQHVHAVVARLRGAHLKRALGQPAQTHAIDSQLSFLGRFTSGQGQFKQFAESEHRASLISDCSPGRARDRLRHLRHSCQPVPFPAAD